MTAQRSPGRRERPFCTAFFGICFLAPERNLVQVAILVVVVVVVSVVVVGVVVVVCSNGTGSHGGSSIVL